MIDRPASRGIRGRSQSLCRSTLCARLVAAVSFWLLGYTAETARGPHGPPRYELKVAENIAVNSGIIGQKLLQEQGRLSAKAPRRGRLLY
jgi:hypothetical protein